MRNDLLYIPPQARDQLTPDSERLKSGWASAKKADGSADPEAIKKTASEFEALFVNYLVKTMQETVGDSELFGKGLGAESYRDMIFQELSRKITQGGGIGLAKQVIEHLQANSHTAEPADALRGLTPAAPVQRLDLFGTRPVPGAPAPVESHPDAGLPAPDAEDVSFIRPVQGRQTSGYGLRSHPISGDVRFHRGVDLAAPQGAPILAARQGQVVFSGYLSGYGNTVIVDHPNGYRTRYAHLQTLDVVAGDTIQQGQRLGQVGKTGRATGPHLHFEVWRDGVPVNPSDLL